MNLKMVLVAPQYLKFGPWKMSAEGLLCLFTKFPNASDMVFKKVS